MKFFRSKSNFLFGVILLAAVVVFEAPAVVKIINGASVQKLGIVFLVLPFIVAVYMFISGSQIIKINDRGVALEVFGIPLKDIEWEKINEAGTGKIKISKNKYMRQLYVSQKRVNEQQLENLEKLRLDSAVIWFDYSLKAEEGLAKHLGVSEE
ncbi:MAG: hypothetical protein E7539_00750 [Ruminococcaceae bacterium]|nr:hypothetical protein [Oscillospiraceae bacterium]